MYDFNNELVELLFRQLSPNEVKEFMEHSSRLRPTTIRTNSIKTKRRDLAKSLISRGVNLDPIEWDMQGLKIIRSAVPLGATQEYLSGA